MPEAVNDSEAARPLRFWVTPTGKAPYEVDLTLFAEGGFRQNVARKHQASWNGDFSGRPVLARQIAEVVELEKPSEPTCRAWLHAIRTFYRFLEAQEVYRAIDSVERLPEAMGVQFKRWLETTDADRTTYGKAKSILDLARSHRGLSKLFWPARKRDVPDEVEDIDEKGVTRLFNALKGEARSVKSMFREGESLSSLGSDPRGEQRSSGSAAWERRENHAWLVRHLTGERLLDKNAIYAGGGRGLNKANEADQQHDGPSYLAPLMTERGREGIVGKLRWFHPSYHDTALFLWLFLIGTGWNLATALSLDVTDDAWVEDHPHKPEFKVIHAPKDRAGGQPQFALSLEEPEWHPYQVVRYMIGRTAPLRRTVLHELALVDEALRRGATPALAKRKADLQAMAKSPWLYHVVNEVGRIGCFHHDDSARLNDIVREVARRGNLLKEHPSLEEFSTGDARDAWIGHAYVQSGYSLLITRLAAQHSSYATLRHYLRQRRFRRHSEKKIRVLQDAAFAQISKRTPLDPTKLKMLIESGQITPEQEKRLADHRQRTRVGMGCLDPKQPPKAVAPTHVEGKLCRIQRCTGCQHGVVFKDSMPKLTRALAELRHIRRTMMPAAAWAGSSFEDETASLEATLSLFDQATVESQLADWKGQLERGEIMAHDTYPSY